MSPVATHADTCLPFREELSALLDGELSEEREREVRSHVDGCADCTAQLASLSAANDALRSLPTPAVPADLEARLHARIALDARAPSGRTATPRRRSRMPVWLGAAVAAAGLAGILLLPRSLDETRIEPDYERALAEATEEEIAIASELDLLEDLDLIQQLDLLEVLDELEGSEAG